MRTRQPDAADRPTPTELSDDQRELLRLLATGVSDHQIARRTGVSLRTVQRRIAGLMAQLGARNRFVLGVVAARLTGER